MALFRIKISFEDGQYALVLVHLGQLVLYLLEVPGVPGDKDGVVQHDVNLLGQHLDVRRAVLSHCVEPALALR